MKSKNWKTAAGTELDMTTKGVRLDPNGLKCKI